jgi:predicted DNA binding protein
VLLHFAERSCPCAAAGLTTFYVISQKYDKNGVATWKVLVRDRLVLRRAIKKIRSGGIPVRLVKYAPAISNYGLTRRQRKLLETAYEKGFFDVPRRIDLRSLAEELGVSRSTIMESLRRAIARVLEQQFSNPLPTTPISNHPRRLMEFA